MTPEDQAVRLAQVDARSKSNTHRIDALEKNQEALHKLATAAEVMATEQKHQTEAIKEIKANVDSLTERWRPWSRNRRSGGTEWWTSS